MDGRGLRLWVNATVTRTESDEWRHVDLFCECRNLGCMKRLLLSHDAYRAAHSSYGRSVVAGGHQHPEDVVVADRGAYLVIERPASRPGALASA
jgi:hypothetical protein